MSRRRCDPSSMLSTPPPLSQAAQAMHDLRPGDRTPVYYTMTTHPRLSPAPNSSHAHAHAHAHSVSLSQSSRSAKVNKSTTTPASSPRAPYSVGQNYPPKLSPAPLPEARAPSPNYFGLVVESAHDQVREHWSPTSSSIKSFAATLPKHVALESNPEFEAFKRQVDINRGKSSFAPPTAHYVQSTPKPTPVRPRPPRWHTHASDTGSDASFGRPLDTMRDQPTSRMKVDQDSLHDSAYVSSDSKRNSESSIFPLQITGLPRFESPRPMDPSQHRTSITQVDGRDSRLSVMEHRPELPSPTDITRAATLPIKLESGQPAMITAAHLKALMETVHENRLLLLDIRSAQSFAISRIKGALNLCIPTTLLRRATVNTETLQQTFHGGSERDKFATWRNMHWIIVYDAHSSDRRDAVAAQNMLKKFTNEGYTGHTGILRGGFNSLLGSSPELIDHVCAVENVGRVNPLGKKGSLAPVIGGVMLPTANCYNPFFSNIRQNIDLADGVGQLDISWPSGLEPSILPRWLQESAAQPDHGKKVSEKFLRIELDEQSRMQSAYAAFNLGYSTRSGRIQLSGVEKGGKNRYKDILPFEHARVRLQNKPEGGCDYLNASHLTPSRSNKRYIASQAPLPDTFEDFWSAVWDQDVRVIVMLTAESEGGQRKCHPYWKDREYGAIKLVPLTEKKASLDIDEHRPTAQTSPSTAASEFNRRRANTMTTVETTPNGPTALQGQAEAPYVIVRKFALSHSAHPFEPMREITHLHFPSWPDFGTPAQPSHLLALVELANIMQRAALPFETASILGTNRAASDALLTTWYDEPAVGSVCRPMLVHCSAGCGRTGTFCTVDSVIDMLKRQRLAKASAEHLLPQEVDSDISMVYSSDAVSSLTNGKIGFKLNLGGREGLDKGKSEDFSQINTSWLQDDSLDLIHKTVEDFRGQRISMVQSLRQFVLCYETVLEWANRVHDRGPTAPGGRRRSGSLQQA